MPPVPLVHLSASREYCYPVHTRACVWSRAIQGYFFDCQRKKCLGIFGCTRGLIQCSTATWPHDKDLRIFECPTGSIGTGVDRGQAPNWCARPTSRTSNGKTKKRALICVRPLKIYGVF